MARTKLQITETPDAQVMFQTDTKLKRDSMRELADAPLALLSICSIVLASNEPWSQKRVI